MFVENGVLSVVAGDGRSLFNFYNGILKGSTVLGGAYVDEIRTGCITEKRK